MARSRSAECRRAVLDAAGELLDEGASSVTAPAGAGGSFTVEAVARRSGVAKTTIYRWWPGAAAIVLDAVAERIGDRCDFPDTGSSVEDLRTQMHAFVDLFDDPHVAGPYLMLIAHSRTDPDLAAALRDRFIAVRRAAATAALLRGVARGDLHPELVPDLVVDALYGALYYRLLVAHEPATHDYVDALLRQFGPALSQTERQTAPNWRSPASPSPGTM